MLNAGRMYHSKQLLLAYHRTARYRKRGCEVANFHSKQASCYLV